MKLTLQEILAGVDASVKAQWETAPVYHGRRPQKFERLSFLLEGGPITRKEIGGGQTQVVATVRLVAFLPVDAYGNSTPKELEETTDSLVELFEGGYIQVGGRCPHVLEVTGDFGFDYAEATAKLEFFDTADDRRAGAENLPYMENIHTKFNEE